MGDINNGVFVVQLLGGDGDGVRQVIEGCRPGDSAQQVGIDWALDLGLDTEDWQILVWRADADTVAADGPPDATVTAGFLPGAAPTRAAVRRSAVPRHRARIRVPAGQLVTKVRAYDAQTGEALVLGQSILVTADRRNTTADWCPGPWYPANTPGGDVVAVPVRGIGATTWRSQDTIMIRTRLGDMTLLPPSIAVIPAEEV